MRHCSLTDPANVVAFGCQNFNSPFTGLCNLPFIGVSDTVEITIMATMDVTPNIADCMDFGALESVAA